MSISSIKRIPEVKPNNYLTLSIPNSNNLGNSITQSFYSNCSSMSLSEHNDDMETYTNQLYCLDNLERFVFSTELDCLMKLNNDTSVEKNAKLKDTKFNKSFKDLKLRKTKIIYKTLLIYKDSESQQLLSTINIDNCFAEKGSRYKLNYQSMPKFLWSLLLTNDNKEYIFYYDSQSERDLCVKKINDLSADDITNNNNYSVCQIIYENSYKGLKVIKVRRKSDGKYLVIKSYQRNQNNSNIIKEVINNYNLAQFFKHQNLLHIEQKIEYKESINISNFILYYFIVNLIYFLFFSYY